MKRILWPALLLTASLCACSPSEKSIQLTATQVASEIFGTQTAIVLAPTATITFTPPLTSTSTPTVNLTPTPTITKIPTATLDVEGVQRMILCYKAAVIVHADMEVYSSIANSASAAQRGFNEEQWRDLNLLRYERHSRPRSNTVEGIDLGDQDCAGNHRFILSANDEIDTIQPYIMGSRSTMQSLSMGISRVDSDLRKALETVYNVDPAELDAIADPIWQNVHNRYGAEIP